MLVSIYMFSWSEKPNMINIICQSLVFFQNGCHFNKCCNVKEQGGAIGLTETLTALLGWMVCGPEMARVVTEFLDGID